MIEWLQNWYGSQCDGEWEHKEGIDISTLDNPGWQVSISHRKALSSEKITLIDEGLQQNADDWIRCTVEGDKFTGVGGPGQLEKILACFREFIESGK